VTLATTSDVLGTRGALTLLAAPLLFVSSTSGLFAAVEGKESRPDLGVTLRVVAHEKTAHAMPDFDLAHVLVAFRTTSEMF